MAGAGGGDAIRPGSGRRGRRGGVRRRGGPRAGGPAGTIGHRTPASRVRAVAQGAAVRRTGRLRARVPRRRRSRDEQRLVSVFRQGLAVLMSVLIAGHALPKPSWKPEAWLEIRCEIKPPPQQPPTPIPKNPSPIPSRNGVPPRRALHRTDSDSLYQLIGPCGILCPAAGPFLVAPVVGRSPSHSPLLPARADRESGRSRPAPVITRQRNDTTAQPSPRHADRRPWPFPPAALAEWGRTRGVISRDPTEA